MKKQILISIPHPIPYQGSKRSLAPEILKYFPVKIERLIEPFAGSSAITLASASHGLSSNYLLNDLNKPLIKLWEAIINSPQKISDQYRKIWNKQHVNNREYYDNIREKFNKTGRPDYLLYLLARCVKSAIRYNSSGEFNQSPDNRRLGTNPNIMEKRILSASILLKGKTTFSFQDYKDVVKTAKENDLIYLDPPYQGVCTNRNSRYFQGVDFDELVSVLELLNKREISYLVSYDGKTGNKTHGKYLPEHLRLMQVKLKAGRSSQATLLGRSSMIYESLYISKALQKKIKK